MATATNQSNAAVIHSGRIAALDGLRGVLALLVLFHHVLITQPDFANFEWSLGTAPAHNLFESIMFYTPLRLLWIGQERALLFFVLSGYVLSLPWLKGRAPSYGQFILDRFCRIYPPYLAIMAIASLGAIFLGGKELPQASIWFHQLGWSQPFGRRAVPSILLLLNNNSSNWVNESVWTLVWELRVMFIYPLMIFFAVRWRNAGLLSVFAALVVMQTVASNLVPAHYAQHFANISSAFHYPEFFVFGMAVAFNQQRIRQAAQNSGALFGLCVFALALVLCWVHWRYNNDRIDGIGGAMIIAAILSGGLVRRWFEAAALVWVGRVSYSLYLVHVPIILTIVILCHGKVPPLACAAAVPLCIVAGEGFRRYVELPSVLGARRLAARLQPSGWFSPVAIFSPPATTKSNVPAGAGLVISK